MAPIRLATDWPHCITNGSFAVCFLPHYCLVLKDRKLSGRANRVFSDRYLQLRFVSLADWLPAVVRCSCLRVARGELVQLFGFLQASNSGRLPRRFWNPRAALQRRVRWGSCPKICPSRTPHKPAQQHATTKQVMPMTDKPRPRVLTGAG